MNGKKGLVLLLVLFLCGLDARSQPPAENTPEIEAQFAYPAAKKIVDGYFIFGDAKFKVRLKNDSYVEHLEQYLRERDLLLGRLSPATNSELHAIFLMEVAAYHYRRGVEGRKLGEALPRDVFKYCTKETLAKYYFMKGAALHSIELGMPEEVFAAEGGEQADEVMVECFMSAAENGIDPDLIKQYFQTYYSANTRTTDSKERAQFKAAAYGRIGALYEKGGNTGAAKEMYVQAIEWGDINTDVYNNVSRIAGNEEAIELMNKGLKNVGNDKERSRVLWGIIAHTYERMEKWKEAVDAYKKAGDKPMADWIKKNKM